MNELIIAGILSLIGLGCLVAYGVPSTIIGFILRIVRHHKMMQPQNVYFRMEVQ